MKKITKALIGTGILLSGIGAAVGIAKAANRSEVDDCYFDDFDDDDFFEEDYDGDVKDTEEE
jgi:hypothetical protein